LEDSEGVCGYVLGALDSKEFYDKFVNIWCPAMRKLYPTIPTDDNKKDNWPIGDFHNLVPYFPQSFSPYPSHLHIDLLPRAQAKGLGKKMIQHLENELKKRGSKGVHLEMSLKNFKALAFYTKLGFTEIDRNEKEEDLFLGKKLV